MRHRLWGKMALLQEVLSGKRYLLHTHHTMDIVYISIRYVDQFMAPKYNFNSIFTSGHISAIDLPTVQYNYIIYKPDVQTALVIP